MCRDEGILGSFISFIIINVNSSLLSIAVSPPLKALHAFLLVVSVSRVLIVLVRSFNSV